MNDDTAHQQLYPDKLTTMREVTIYWRSCLNELKDENDDNSVVAGHMVGVVSNERDDAWQSPIAPDAHPAYPLIFELAASLEIREDTTKPRIAELRADSRQCIRALVSVLEAKYLNER